MGLTPRILLVSLCLLVSPVCSIAGVISVQSPVRIDDAIGVSYRVRVEAQTGRDYGKILFMAHSLYNPANCTGASCPQHQIEMLIGNSSHVPQTGDCCWDGAGVLPNPPLCALYNAAPWSGLRAGVWAGGPQDAAGLRMSDPILWPRRTLGVDANHAVMKIEAPYQRDITGLDVSVHWLRGDLLPVEDRADWGRSCLTPMSASRPMRQWHLAVTLGSETFGGIAVLPNDEATHLRPDRLIEFVTEFFEFPGTVRIFVWDVMVERETGERVPLTDWHIVSRHPGVPTGYWGIRKAQYAGREVLEFGTDPTLAYQSEPGTIITLRASAQSIPAVSTWGSGALIVVFGAALAAQARWTRQ